MNGNCRAGGARSSVVPCKIGPYLVVALVWGCSPTKPPTEGASITVRHVVELRLAPSASAHAPPATRGSAPAERGLWRAELDLDGDGKTERAELVTRDTMVQADEDVDDDPRIGIGVPGCHKGDSQVEGCHATLRVGDDEHEIVLQRGYFGGIGIRAIDIDPTDGFTELLLTQRGGDAEDPPFVFTVATYRRRLRVHPLFASSGYNSGEVKLNGGGGLDVVYDECPDKTTVAYAFQGDELTEIAKTVERVRDPSRCAG
jgi:hypothetical protein